MTNNKNSSGVFVCPVAEARASSNVDAIYKKMDWLASNPNDSRRYLIAWISDIGFLAEAVKWCFYRETISDIESIKMHAFSGMPYSKLYTQVFFLLREVTDYIDVSFDDEACAALLKSITAEVVPGFLRRDPLNKEVRALVYNAAIIVKQFDLALGNPTPIEAKFAFDLMDAAMSKPENADLFQLQLNSLKHMADPCERKKQLTDLQNVASYQNTPDFRPSHSRSQMFQFGLDSTRKQTRANLGLPAEEKPSPVQKGLDSEYIKPKKMKK